MNKNEPIEHRLSSSSSLLLSRCSSFRSLRTAESGWENEQGCRSVRDPLSR